MKFMMRCVAVLFVVVGATCAIAAQPPTPSTTTTIVNGAGNPVPIGTVDPTNGSVVAASPTMPVPVSIKSPATLPVTVTGTSASPIAVTNAPVQPVQFSNVFQYGGSEFGTPNVWHLPSGKRLVIEFVALYVHLEAGQRVYLSFLNNDDDHGFVQQQYALLGSTQDLGANGVVYVVNQQVRIYVDHAFDVTGFTTNFINGDTTSGYVAVSGYLVDAP